MNNPFPQNKQASKQTNKQTKTTMQSVQHLESEQNEGETERGG